MPLMEGTSERSKRSNIRMLRHEGKPKAQAVAIAMDVARRKKKKTKPSGY